LGKGNGFGTPFTFGECVLRLLMPLFSTSGWWRNFKAPNSFGVQESWEGEPTGESSEGTVPCRAEILLVAP